MKVDGWMYYNHAAIPIVPPHEDPNTEVVLNGLVWKMDGNPILARWTTDFDCGYETQWWYNIRKRPFLVEELSRSSRKEIRSSLKNNIVEIIDPAEFRDDLYDCYKCSFDRYKNADNMVSLEDFNKWIDNDIKRGTHYWAAFERENNILIGYMRIGKHDRYVEIETAKFNPNYLRLHQSTALYASVLDYYLNQLSHIDYVSSGSRSINHLSNTEDYKEKHFGYEKAYCHLHVAYAPGIKPIIKLAGKISFILDKLDRVLFIHHLNAIVKLDSYQS